MPNSILRTGSGQRQVCQVVQEKGNAECQLSVFVSVSLAVFGMLLLLPVSAIYSEANKKRSIIIGQDIIDTLELSCCWRGQKSAHF